MEALFDELAELAGQRNAVDARIVDIVAEIDGDRLWGNTGCRSVAALVAWKTGTSPTNAATIAAGRLGTPEEFGAMCAWLCSVQAGFVSGQNLSVDGGSYPGVL
mgnify:CR=1 FL=1